jgi:hypothetical protein
MNWTVYMKYSQRLSVFAELYTSPFVSNIGGTVKFTQDLMLDIGDASEP